MENIYQHKVLQVNNVFDSYFIDSPALYLNSFNKLPSQNYIDGINGEKAFLACKEKFSSQTKHIYGYRFFKQTDKSYQFDKTIMLMENNCILEFDDHYCSIFHNNQQDEFIEQVTLVVSSYRERQKKQPNEIALVTFKRNQLELRTVEIKKAKLDLNLFYEDDFQAVHQLIKRRLNKKDEKGIVLLHGIPGSGKTSYLRYLVAGLRKPALFLSPSAAANITNPDFLDLLIQHNNSIIIIEDAETVIMDRRHYGGSGVSNLLNISDGFLADALKVQLICTFNNALSIVDPALLRPGRLIARYEFGKLSVGKAARLSAHFGFDHAITEPMTIADIAHPQDRKEKSRMNEIGFRQHLIKSM